MINVIINGIEIIDGWVLAKREIGTPKPKLVKVDVPSRDGQLDVTSRLFGTNVPFGNRIIKLSLVNVYGGTTDIKWKYLLTNAMNNYHGKDCTIEFSDDIGWQYKGRGEITDFSIHNEEIRMSIEFDCDPYKYEIGTGRKSF